LPAYYNEYVTSWNKITSVEKPYRNVVVKGIPLNGKLDKLEFTGNLVDVIDYKTGSYKNAKDKFKRPNQEAVEIDIAKGKEPSFEDVHGGDYWRQAVFYKLLMDYDVQKNWEMQKSIFDFVEPLASAGDKGATTYTFHKETITILPEDLEVVTKQIQDTFQGIQNKEFKNGCNKDDCHWCNFVKNYYTGKVLDNKIGITAQEED
jgi:DNA helicase-2/ATP-dependent DNA helicase PcrA